jgi:hypothetical protein
MKEPQESAKQNDIYIYLFWENKTKFHI